MLTNETFKKRTRGTRNTGILKFTEKRFWTIVIIWGIKKGKLSKKKKKIFQLLLLLLTPSAIGINIKIS